jgi:hypothetical protein
MRARTRSLLTALLLPSALVLSWAFAARAGYAPAQGNGGAQGTGGGGGGGASSLQAAYNGGPSIATTSGLGPVVIKPATSADALVLTNNTAAPVFGEGVDLVMDGAQAVYATTAYGVGDNPAFLGRQARGSVASPSASQTGDILSQLTAHGYGATGFSAGSRGKFAVVASENWTDTAQGTYLQAFLTGTGTTTNLQAMLVNATSLAVGYGVTGSGTDSTVLGATATDNATTKNVVVGWGATNGDASVTFGQNVVIGYNANGGPGGSNGGNVVIGATSNAGAGSGYNVVLGYASSCSTFNSTVVIGEQSFANGNLSVSVGQSSSGGPDGVSVGATSNSGGTGGIAIGYGCVIPGTVTNSFAIQASSADPNKATASGQFVIGSDTAPMTATYLGRGFSSATPDAFVDILATQGSGANVAGSGLALGGGAGTGTAGAGNTEILYAPPGGSSSTLNAYAPAVTVNGSTGITTIKTLEFGTAGTTGSTTNVLGTAGPNSTSTPNTWVTVKLSDGSTGYMPVWK